MKKLLILITLTLLIILFVVYQVNHISKVNEQRIEVALESISTVYGDFSHYYNSMNLDDSVKFVWWWQYRSEEAIIGAENTFKTSLPRINLQSKYIVISCGRKLEKLEYKKCSKKICSIMRKKSTVGVQVVTNWC